jgi:cytochrome c oxidase subunit 2
MYKWILAVLFFGSAALGIGILFNELPTPPTKEELAAAENTLTIEASNFDFDQAEYVVEAGSTMTVALKNAQGLHGISISGLGVDLQGANLSQEVTFGEAGTEYEIVCIVLCGEGHAEMKSKIVVQ